MTTVHIKIEVPVENGLEPAVGSMLWTPTRRRETEDSVVLPASFRATLVGGVLDIDLAPTNTAWVWRVDEQFTNAPAQTYYYTVPDSVPTVNYKDLVAVDPDSLEPTAHEDPIWQSELALKLDKTAVGAANGAAPLGADSLVPSEFLPAVAVASVVSTDITDSTAVGRSVITSADAAAARTAVGLGNVDNTSDSAKPVSSATQTALDAKVDDSEKGVANGVATLGADGLVPPAQLPAASGGTSYELRGTGMPNGVVTAQPGTYYTDTVGAAGAWRWLKTSGTGNTGWTVIHGDTGWRSLTVDTAMIGASGMVRVRRINDVVYLKVLQNSNTTAGTVLTLPSGFLPAPDTDDAYGGVRPGTTTVGAIRISNGAIITMQASMINQHYRPTFPTTDAWPNTLPGTSV